MPENTKILGLDYGERRIGVALSDRNKLIAAGHSTIDCRKEKNPLEAIAQIISKEQVEAIVVGYPQRTDDKPGGKAADVNAWIKLLKKSVSLPVYRQDESYTSQAARQSLQARGKKIISSRDKHHIDRVAACFILQDYLDNRRKSL